MGSIFLTSDTCCTPSHAMVLGGGRRPSSRVQTFGTDLGPKPGVQSVHHVANHSVSWCHYPRPSHRTCLSVGTASTRVNHQSRCGGTRATGVLEAKGLGKVAQRADLARESGAPPGRWGGHQSLRTCRAGGGRRRKTEVFWFSSV